MTPFEKAESLWGEHWKSVLAHLAGVKKRTVFRWYADGWLPDDVTDGIEKTYEVWRDPVQQ